MTMTSKIKGKTWEEFYGLERAKEIKEKMRIKKISKIGKSNPFYGKRHSEVSKIKIGLGISKALKGKKFTEEHKRKISLALKGKPKSEEHKMKYSKTMKKLYIEGKLINHRKGKFHTEETKIKMKQNHADVLGKNNPAWLGGKSFEPYCPKFNNEFKNLIRLRDNFCCLNCGMSEQKHIIIRRRKLAIHHIDYNKKNTCLQNCCALCDSCNIKANKNRNIWTDYYQKLLKERYGYNYDEIGNVLINMKTINDTNINLFGIGRGDNDDEDF